MISSNMTEMAVILLPRFSLGSWALVLRCVPLTKCLLHTLFIRFISNNFTSYAFTVSLICSTPLYVLSPRILSSCNYKRPRRFTHFIIIQHSKASCKLFINTLTDLSPRGYRNCAECISIPPAQSLEKPPIFGIQRTTAATFLSPQQCVCTALQFYNEWTSWSER